MPTENPDRDFSADDRQPAKGPQTVTRNDFDDLFDDPAVRHRIGMLIARAIYRSWTEA